MRRRSSLELAPQGLRVRLAGAALAAAGLALAPAPNAEACGWDYETYHAEAKKLPCVTDTLLGYTTPHTQTYYIARLSAMNAGLAVVPNWLEGLDNKGLSLMFLGRLEEAEAALKRRHELAPNAYPGHANLGTLYTFMGRFDDATKHIEAAMKIEPDAHFGREGVHLALVKHLAAVKADPTQAGKNFMGLTLTKAQRLKGNPSAFKAAGFTDRDIDALIAMLTVYGAADHPDILYALGDLLALKGMKRLAWTAYRRARSAKHPNTGELYRLEKSLNAALEKEWKAANPQARRDSYAGIQAKYGSKRKKSERFRAKYQKWEEEQLAAGLEVWTEAGLTTMYAHIDDIRPRCKVAPKPGDATTDDQAQTPKSVPKAKDKPVRKNVPYKKAKGIEQ